MSMSKFATRADYYLDIIRRCHEAIREHSDSDHASLPDAIAKHVWERQQRIDELERDLGIARTAANSWKDELMRLKASRPEAGRSEQTQYVERLKRLHNWIIFTKPYLLDEFAASGFYDALPAARSEEQ